MNNTGLSVIGYYWVLISLFATICVIAGFYMPYWILGTLDLNGKKNIVYFGSFRRCNYPVFDEDSKQFRIEELCGRYSGFNDIPSIYWQVSTCLIAFGCLLTTTLSLILIPSCCFKHIVSKNSAILIGLLQAVAAVCVSCGCLLYPLGWDNQEVRDACGPLSGKYFLGECQVGWAYICMLIGSALLLTCGALSICGGREPDADPHFTSYRNRFRPAAVGQPPTRYSFDAETLIDHNLRRHSLATSTGRRTSTQRIFRPLNPTSSHLPQCDV